MAFASVYLFCAVSRARLALACPSAASILRQVGGGLVQRGLERPGIDGEQQVAGLDVIALVEVNGGQLAAHLRLHGNGRVGFHVADDLDLHRDVLLGGHGYGDGHVAGAAAPPAALSARSAAAGAPEVDAPPFEQPYKNRSDTPITLRFRSTCRNLPWPATRMG